MDDPDHFRKLGDVPAQKKVHSLAIDLETHSVYTPLQEDEGAPASRLVVYEAVTSPCRCSQSPRSPIPEPCFPISSTIQNFRIVLVAGVGCVCYGFYAQKKFLFR